MAEIVILGAGPTGISAAYHLEKKGFYDYKIFEKEPNIGGLCRSIRQDGFTFDFTGHLLHINDEYFRQFLQETINFEDFNNINRRSFVYSENTFTKYPYQINLHGLPTATIAQCLAGFIKRKKIRKKNKSFYDWVIENFGSGFAKYFFVPYQEKIFSYDIKKLSATWTGRFVPQTSLIEMINGALKDNETKIGYNSNFIYPKQGGINFWVNKIAEKIKNRVHTNFCVEKVDLVNKIVHFTNGEQENFKHLITTIPLDHLLNNLKEDSTTTLYRSANNLLCNSVINFNIGLKGNVSDKHWIYYPEKQYPFYRVGFWHNFSQLMAPEGHSSLYGEFSFLNKSNKYQNLILKKSLNHAYKLFEINTKDIVTQKVITIKHAYVIYNHWRDKHVPEILNILKTYNVNSIGRYGAWKYSSMQEAILDGKKVVDQIII
ncbi:FAD-dependent oxidoreductase [Candidatus Dependentiae bacterium]|nr:FAD-dependent oxidoreductase [Candidatus Dependentiae bacterium]